MPKQKLSSLFRRIFSILIFLVISSLALELFLRIFYPQNTLLIIEQREKTLSIFKESHYLPWELAPRKQVMHIGPENDWKVKVQINSKGLRDREIDYDKPKGTYRILVLDSFAFGYGVELNESYGKVLEQLLNKNSGTKRYEVINAGFAAGDSIDTAYLFLKNEGLKYKPDLAIFGYVPSNDLENVETHQWRTDSAGLPVSIKYPSLFISSEGIRASMNPAESQSIFWGVHLFFSRHSHLFTYIKNKLKATFIASEFRKLYEPKGSGIYDETYSNSLSGGWEKTKFLFSETNNLLKANNAKFAVVYIPDKSQPVDSAWEDYIKVSGKEYLKLSRTKPQDMLKEFAAANSIEVIDFYPVFNEHQTEQLYFNIDPHWTKKGQYLAGKTIYGEFYEPQN